MLKRKKDKKKAKTLKRNKKSFLTRARKNLNSFMPMLIVWLLRILVTFQLYMYHDLLSMVHLVWVLLSFVLPINIMLFGSIMVMIPIYSFEFIMIYGMRIPLVKDLSFFVVNKGLFNWEMRYPMLEQLLYFFILNLFFMTISCFKLAL